MSHRSLAVMLVITLSLATVPWMLLEGEGKQSTPDGGGYKYTDGQLPEPIVQAKWYSVKGNPKAIGLDTSQWDALIRVDLGFNFLYYGQSYNKVYISTYGAMSFVDSSASSFQNYWNYQIPSSSRPQGVLAVYWTWDTCYSTSKDRIYVLQTDIDGEKVFCVEWNTQNGGQFEAFLYESGMILYQYQSTQSWYRVGEYCVIGIESPDDSKGTVYTNWKTGISKDLFNVPFAIGFTRENVDVEDLKLEDGYGRDGKTLYAGAKDYTFSTTVKHSRSGDDVRSVLLTLGSYAGQENIRMMYYHTNKTFVQLSGYLYASLNADDSTAAVSNILYLDVIFKVDFKVAYPSEDMRNVTVKATGKSAVPGLMDFSEVYWVETEIEWDPSSLIVKKVSSGVQTMKTNDFIAASQTIQFSGVKLFYQHSDVQPRSSLLQVNVTDNFGVKKIAYIVQGFSLDVTWTTADYATPMQWDFVVYGIDPMKLLSNPFSFQLVVDANPPNMIKAGEILVRPDALTDQPSDFDNDQRVFVEWSPSDDGESGIGGYYVDVFNDGDYSLRSYVGALSTSVEVGKDYGKELPEGKVHITVTSIDKVGNQRRSEPRDFLIDLTGPSFSIISPLPEHWAVKNDPDVVISVSDTLSGVDGGSLFYRTSKDGGYTFTDWQTCNAYGKKDKVVNVTVRPSLTEGKNNVMEIKGTDLATSQEVISPQIPIWIDSRTPLIKMTEPVVDLNGTTLEWMRSNSDALRISTHDWLGAGIDPKRISYRYSLNNGQNFSSDIPLEGEGFNNTQGYFEYAFTIRKNWQEGDGNVLRVEVFDLMGRSSFALFKIKIDMTPEITLVSPGAGSDYLDNMTITFSVRIDDPDGNEDISVTWTSSIDGRFGNTPTVQAKLSEGEHIITIAVDDKVHIVKRTFTLLVRPASSVDPEHMDSDNDGMTDAFETLYGFDPNRNDANEDKDGDTYSNLAEYYARTDPNDKGDYPGSTLREEKFPVFALVVVILSILLFLIACTLTVMEYRKAAPPPQSFPPMFYGYSAPPMTMQPQVPVPPALPPAPPAR